MRHAAVWNRWCAAATVLAAVWFSPACRAQLAAPPATIEDALKAVATQAGVIFAGSVTRVIKAENGDARVEFAVEEGLRGATSGGSYTMRLSSWAGGAERFHTGERALFLLHAPSAAGYSSPVEGEHGVVPLSGDTTAGSVDLRWLATAVLRDAPVRAEAVSAAVVTAATVSAPAARLSTAEQRQSNVTGQDVQAIDRDLVTGMLRTWDAAAVRSQAVAGAKTLSTGRAR